MGATLKVSLPGLEDPCTMGTLVLNANYLVAGNYDTTARELRISRCGNYAAAVDEPLADFVRNYFNWATGRCAAGSLQTCAADPCSHAPACNVPDAVCVPTLCNRCGVVWWQGTHRV